MTARSNFAISRAGEVLRFPGSISRRIANTTAAALPMTEWLTESALVARALEDSSTRRASIDYPVCKDARAWLAARDL